MNPPTDRPFVLVAGAASRDITGFDSRGWRLGGAVTYASLTLARLGLGVGAVVGVDAIAESARELDAIAAAGGTVIRVPLASGPVFEIAETATGRRLRCVSTSEPLRISGIPRAWLVHGTPAFLGPVANELGPEWNAVGGGHLALGWQGLLRDLRAGQDVGRTVPGPHPLLDVATLVGLSREDVAREASLQALASCMPAGATLVCTDGERGGDVITFGPNRDVADPWHYPAVPSDRIVDPTGAGDVFLAAMLAARLDPTLGPDVLVGAAAASLAVEAAGVEGIPTRDTLRERMRRAASLASRWESDDSSLASGRPIQA